jgi:lipoate---protein ligase
MQIQRRDILVRTAYNIYKTKKLIKILLKYEDDKEGNRIISSVRITGDFFLYPEESLENLEVQLKGTRLDKDNLKKKIDKCLNNSEAFGFDSKSLSDAILGCLQPNNQIVS